MNLTTLEQDEWSKVLPFKLRFELNYKGVTKNINQERSNHGTNKYYWDYWTELFCIASQVLKEPL